MRMGKQTDWAPVGTRFSEFTLPVHLALLLCCSVSRSLSPSPLFLSLSLFLCFSCSLPLSCLPSVSPLVSVSLSLRMHSSGLDNVHEPPVFLAASWPLRLAQVMKTPLAFALTPPPNCPPLSPLYRQPNRYFHHHSNHNHRHHRPMRSMTEPDRQTTNTERRNNRGSERDRELVNRCEHELASWHCPFFHL